jgi:hypothetical protein
MRRRPQQIELRIAHLGDAHVPGSDKANVEVARKRLHRLLELARRPVAAGALQLRWKRDDRHDECILCISRLGRLYVLEDGAGQVLAEHNSLLVLAEQARRVLHKKRAQIVGRVAVLWCAIRELFEEKLEPIVGESEELLTHLVPQLAAFA